MYAEAAPRVADPNVREVAVSAATTSTGMPCLWL